jgi:uncharacterized membrane protein
MRIVAKTMTYGLMHIVVAFFVALFVTRDLHIALAISLLEPFVQIAFFSVHEYFWSKGHPGVPSPHKGCCSSAFDLSKVLTFLSLKKAR